MGRKRWKGGPRPPRDSEAVGLSSEALFRAQVVGLVKAHVLGGRSRTAAIREASAASHFDFSGQLRQVSARTLHRWVVAYDESQLAGLERRGRTRRPGSKALPEAFLVFAVAQKAADVHASVPELIARGRGHGLLGPEAEVCRTTVYRAMRALGASMRRRKAAADRDSRRFVFPHRMLMVLSDGKHFRAGASRAKRVALFFLDDCSRYGLHVVVDTSENTRVFLRGLYETLCCYGWMDVLYLDHGPGFVSEDTGLVCSREPRIVLVNGEVRYPEGHGKIEAFNRTALAAVLRNLAGRPDIDPDCRALELRLQHWLREHYNQQPHESLGKQTPYQVFHGDERALRLPETTSGLQDRFVVTADYRVSADHVVRLGDTYYEMPLGTAGMRATIQTRFLDGKVLYLHQGQLIELHPVDKVANARRRRSRRRSEPDGTPAAPPPPSAADLAFARDFAPVVDADGGFRDPATRPEQPPRRCSPSRPRSGSGRRKDRH